MSSLPSSLALNSYIIKDQRMPYIDLRSDTVTWPTLEMRSAMANAIVGDDVFGDDPTVKQLEAEAAKMFGKEAGLFVSSGTQGNLLALMTHCKPGDEAIMGDCSHTFLYEAGGVSAVAGVLPHCVPVHPDGTLKLEDIENAVRTVDDHFPTTRLVIIENTQNKKGGVPLPASYLDAVGRVAKKHNLKFHIDGARIFNAAAAFNLSVKILCRAADSVTFCLSKGLGAPAGSVLVGSKEFILSARRKRKMLGGGMRQVGTLAAAGLVALKQSTRLSEDHENAVTIATALKQIEGISVRTCYTNFVWFELNHKALTPEDFSNQLWEGYKIKLTPYSGNLFRCSLHLWVGAEQVEVIVRGIREVVQKAARGGGSKL